jgi:glycosyltransferase involved in cell wall biosynthesis
MRILMVSEDVPHPAMGGLGKHAVTLTHALASAGHQVDFMGSQRFPYDDVARNEMKLPGQFFPDLWWRFGSWKESRLGFFNPLRRAVLAREFARIILARAGSYDVVHYHGHVPDLAAFIPATVNFVQTRHDQGSDCLTHVRFRNGEVCTAIDPVECASCAARSPGVVQRSLSVVAVKQYRTRVKHAFTSHKVIFVSDMLRRNFARCAGGKEWGFVVHNFVSDDVMQQSQIAISTQLKATGMIDIFVAGKLYQPKGVEPLLIKLQGRLPPNTILRIAGDGPDETRLRSTFATDSIKFLGWKSYPETLRLMGQSDIVIVPSICEESCATTILEALALGKLVHALNQGGTPELRCYERFPNQLRLHNDMNELVADLLHLNHPSRDELLAPFSDDVRHRMVDLLRIYNMDRAAVDLHRPLTCIGH